MIQALKSAKVFVCIGSGGVGKTTLSATLGFLAASQGKRVLVLTIDPSKRLKTTLGIDEESDVSQVKHSKITGSMSAAVINPKKTFDDFVRRAAKVKELSDKILRNKLYIQLSTTLNGSQEFTALERLYSEYESGNYDLIILDTPPSKHVIDFLEAPQKLSSVFNEGIAKWLREPKVSSSIFQFGTRKVLKALEVLTGSEFIKELSDFFSDIHAWQDKLEERIHKVHQVLVNKETKFCLVTGFDTAKLKEAEYLFSELKKGGYHLDSIVLNRAFPNWFIKDSQQKVPEGTKLGLLFHQMTEYFRERQKTYSSFAQGLGGRTELFTIAEQDFDIADLDGIEKLAEYILAQKGDRA